MWTKLDVQYNKWRKKLGKHRQYVKDNRIQFINSVKKSLSSYKTNSVTLYSDSKK